MKKILFIILPKDDDSSPIKGVIALANCLCKSIEVKIIFLNNSKQTNSINKKIKVYKIKKSLLFKLFELKKIINKYQNYEINTLSFSLNADLINLLIKSNVKEISTSIRGNLIKNYQNTYGSVGFFVAKFHYFLIKRFHKIFSMNKEMSDQIKVLSNKKSIIVGNFIDENFHRKFFKKKKRFKNRIIFMGRLDKRKNPLLLINGFIKLQKGYPKSELIILGEGPLKKKILKIKKTNKLDNIKIFGHVKNPIRYLINSDLLISTSLSEGISRSILESLFYGVPVMISGVDGSNKIIKQYKNGYVYRNDNDFIIKLKEVLTWSSIYSKKRECLLPYYLRQNYVVDLYLKNLI